MTLPATSRLSRRRLLELSVALAALTLGDTLKAHAEDEDPHWSYEGEAGPDAWGDLDEEFATCSIGEAQSPIAIDNTSAANLTDVRIEFGTISPLTIVNNGHTIQITPSGGNTARIGSATYDLLQFHFHTPSEHVLDGQQEVMELHLVLRNANGSLAVLGLLLREGTENVTLEPVFANLPNAAGEELTVDAEIDLMQLLPAGSPTYRYSGSLTTPPCSEGVEWIVFATPVEVSPDQAAAFADVVGPNARPVQPANDRTILEDQPDA